MADPLIQAWSWFQLAVHRLAVPIALGIGLYWAYLLYQRTQNDTDPSIRKFSSGGIGGLSFVVSGTYLSAAIAAVIALVTWPAPMDTPAIGFLLVAGVVFHAILEYREMAGAGG